MSVSRVRIMTYQVGSCRGSDGRSDPGRVAEVIAEGCPDIVAVQNIDADSACDHLQQLEKRLGMTAYSKGRRGCNAFLSYFPLAGLREYDLGDGGSCLRGDADVRGKRLHLFNLLLKSGLRRGRQVQNLLSRDLLGDDALVCPALIVGDFGDIVWTLANLELNIHLRQARRPLWSATYPARFPLIGRDRAYLKGKIEVLESHIGRSRLARCAAPHLPLILTVEIHEPACTLRVKEIKSRGMEVAAG
ncbi:Metal-dependent hydrolase, endonuclease/exonuclease/phosphatase family [Geoalkalibacter ferrihydriticus]|uniref:Endonuclease/exonuclease/phosphatase domain-containing protein n=2 Tax=Geoalkalibacter ferrihydriticus TaxID=392333 RepID=A0A0C2DW55_9BACT|nr:hypothetical protein [Geoalkalibacter ferrihydriticus]KIH77654.1 hypothetical protein GFER_03005 [Geoalkalibacter ferrihydriticus DSM 17813]SDL72200.1 Metal-dependent hydrolase, endonuclease/exonuclease/phosphatase family [Geoalkalibacter ferrihydriticus]